MELLGMPQGVEYIFQAINRSGKTFLIDKGLSDDFTCELERFTEQALQQGAVRVTADLALRSSPMKRKG